jgi:hypothetical integral membrane protein (TIGR02206 family)
MDKYAGWSNYFAPYTRTHLYVVIAFLLFIAMIVSLRRCDEVADDHSRRRLVDKTFGWIALAAACFVQISTLWPTRFNYLTALPLHICDLGMFMAPCELLLRWRWLRDMAYFWGLGLSSISFIYPDLHFGPRTFQFWIFWAGHAATVGPAIYDITGRGFRPNWRDWWFAVKFSLAYTLIIFPVDWIFHLNYGYIGATYKGQRSPVDSLGPWPARVPLMFVMAVGVMLLLMLPWHIGRKVAAPGAGPGLKPAHDPSCPPAHEQAVR